MWRRGIGWAVLGSAALGLTVAGGCRSPRPSVAKADPIDKHAPEAVEFDHTGVHAVDGDGKGAPQPFFKNNRKAGGLSSEARDIERSLGVQ